MPRTPRKIRRGELTAPAPRRRREVAGEAPISTGTPTTYVVCPLCGRNRVMELTSDASALKDKIGPIRWDFWDFRRSPIIQIRAGGGKKPGKGKHRYPGSAEGSGFHIIAELTWIEAELRAEFEEQLNGIKAQLARLQKLL